MASDDVEHDVDMDSGISSSDDEDGDVMVSPQELKELQSRVAASPMDFSANKALLAAYRTNMMFMELRAAREAFSARLPLPEGTWLVPSVIHWVSHRSLRMVLSVVLVGWCSGVVIGVSCRHVASVACRRTPRRALG